MKAKKHSMGPKAPTTRKRATGEKTGMAELRSNPHQAMGSTATTVSNGPKAVPTRPGNPRTGMGVKKGSAPKPSQGGAGGSEIAAGRSRTNRGRNRTGQGPQGFRG